MKGKAVRGIISFCIILLAIGIAWWVNYSFDAKNEHVDNFSLEDSIKRGKERAKIARDSSSKTDSVYRFSEDTLKRVRYEIKTNAPAIARKRDSLRTVLKARAYADSVNRK